MPDSADLREAVDNLNASRLIAPGRIRVRLIAGDVQGSSGFYPAEVLRRDGPQVFRAGLHSYVNHPTASESVERPERSVLDLAGRLASDARYEADGLYADIEVFPRYRDVIESMRDAIGMSIRAMGSAEPSTQEGVRGPIITELTEALSVDFVTVAGAGGKIVELIESARAKIAEVGQLAEAAVSDKPWSDFGQGDYDIGQWRRACLIGPDSQTDNKTDYKLPVREPDGTLNRNAVHAAAGGHGVSAVTGVPAEQKTAAAKKLVGLYRSQLKEDPPEGLLRAAGMTAAKESAAAAPANLAEARNVGGWLESKIHTSFTCLADDMYGQGRITRDERIALSSAVSDALAAFTRRVEAEQPQLYKRDLWQPPEDDGGEMTEAARRLLEGHGMTANDLTGRLVQAVKETYGGKQIFTWVRDNTDDWVVFALESDTDSALYQQPYRVDGTSKAVALAGEPVEVVAATTYTPARAPGAPGTPGITPPQQEADDASGGTPADNTEQMEEGSMPELTDEQVRELTEARDKATAEATTALAEAERARTELARFRAAEQARPAAAKVIAESGLPAAAQTRILGQVVNADTVPLTEADTLDDAKFKTTVEAAVKAEQAYLASLAESGGAGVPRGLGESAAAQPGAAAPDPKVTDALTEAYVARGLTKEAARLAAAGRPL